MPDGMTREELRAFTSGLRTMAIHTIRTHAREHCPRVSPADVDAVCRAFPDVSVDEAITWLNTQQEILET